MAGIRIDKWLWAARFFKTRSLATEACDSGRILCNGQPSKPSRVLQTGNQLEIRNEGGLYQIEVLILSDQRTAAAIASTYYSESDASKDARKAAAELRREQLIGQPSPRVKPGKRDRRLIHRFTTE